MRVMYQNRVDLSTTTITAGSAAADLPVANIAHPHRTKVYRTGTSAAAEWILIDLGGAMAVQSVVILDHTLTAGDSAIKLQGNATNVWTAPSVDQTITYNASVMAAYLSASQSYQYWRIIFTKSAAGQTRDIGRVYLGPYDEYARGPKIPDGIRIKPVDLSITERARGGQTYSDILDSYDEIDIEFPEALADAQSAQIFALAASCGTHTPFFVSIDPTNHGYSWLYYVKARSIEGQTVRYANGATCLWRASMKLAEEL